MAKGILKFREDRCKGCELCVSVCPKKILAVSETHLNRKGYYPVTLIDEDACVGCGSCALMCPDGVISVYQAE